jgi:hypothetical protein
MESTEIKSTEMKALWNRTVKGVFTGALVYAIAGGLWALALTVTSMDADSTISKDLLANSSLFTIGIIVGYALYMRNLTAFAKALNSEDDQSVRLIGIGAIAAIIAVVWQFIISNQPFATTGRIFMMLVFVAAYGVMALAFWRLSQSADFTPQARRGAKRLFYAQILLIAGVVIVELLRMNLSDGAAFGYILSVGGYILVYMGWLDIRNAYPGNYPSQQTEENMHPQGIWYRKTNVIYKGILVYVIAGIAHAALEPFADLADGISFIGMMSGGNSSSMDGVSYTDNMAVVAIIVGYFLFLQGLKGFSGILNPQDGAQVKKIRNGVILGIIAAAIDFIPLIGIVSGIVNLIAFIIMLLAYSALKNSATFPPQARRGAGTLFTSQILIAIGVVLGWIPLIGGFFEFILSGIAYILVLVGWSTIRKANPEAGMTRPGEYPPYNKPYV